MSLLKEFLPGLFGNSKGAQKIRNGKVGRLETDAVPVDDREDDDNGDMGEALDTTSNNNSLEILPTDSMILGESSGALSPMTSTTMVAGGGAVGTAPGVGGVVMAQGGGAVQQQLVMQFSNVNKLHFGSVYNFNNNINTTAPTPTPTPTTTPATGTAGHSRKSSASGTDEVAAAAGGSAEGAKPRKTTSIVAMMQSTDEPNHRILDVVATHLGEGWKQVMRELGHSDGQIEQALIDHQVHGGIKEVIYQLLLQWVRNADDGVGTLGYITTLLWASNHRDCVQRMKLVWKSETHRKTSR